MPENDYLDFFGDTSPTTFAGTAIGHVYGQKVVLKLMRSLCAVVERNGSGMRPKSKVMKSYSKCC